MKTWQICEDNGFFVEFEDELYFLGFAELSSVIHRAVITPEIYSKLTALWMDA